MTSSPTKVFHNLLVAHSFSQVATPNNWLVTSSYWIILILCPQVNNDLTKKTSNGKKETMRKKEKKIKFWKNKAGNTATPVACGWAGAVIEVTISFWQEQ